MLNEKFLYELLETPSPSGFEFEIQKKIINEMKDVSDVVYKNQNYNVINAINPNSKMRVLLSGHIDEIGLVINEICNDGTCKLTKTGGIRPHMYIGQHVNVVKFTKDGYKFIPGVIGYCPNYNTDIKVKDLILDLGCSSKEECSKLVSIGDPVIHMNTYQKLNGDFLSARALDDRIGAFISLEILRKCKEKKCKVGVYASTTVGEETTYRGAHSLTEEVNPTCSIVIDVTYANDIRYSNDLTGDIKLGNGPALTKGSIINPIMEERMMESCNKLNIKPQLEAFYERTFTDADAIYNKKNGVPVYLVSIPLRYMHSSVEVCKLSDVEEIIDVITDFILSLDENISFNRFDY